MNRVSTCALVLTLAAAKKDDKPRATVFTLTHETLEVSANVGESDIAIPAGFKQK